MDQINALAMEKPNPPAVTQTRESQLTVLERIETLEDRLDYFERILAGLLPTSRRRSGSPISWLRALLQTHRIEPGSTNGPG